jgi:CspA family cold shock protein
MANAANGRKTGTVKWFRPDRGFGFILPSGGGPDVFAHANDIVECENLAEGQRVSYLPGTDRRGRAIAVQVVRLP